MAVRLVPVEDGPPINLDRPIVFVVATRTAMYALIQKNISSPLLHYSTPRSPRNPRPGQYERVIVMAPVEEADLTLKTEVQIANIRYKVVVNDSISGSPVTGRNDSARLNP